MISVLYVDDESILCDITKLYLEKVGDMSVTTLNRAEDALISLKTTSYDAVVSDYQMPEMDGIEFLKSLRTQKKNLPFILFTGKGREEVVIQALNEGADFYLQKGGDAKAQFTELAHKIRQAVEKRNVETKKAQKALLDSEQQYNELLMHLPDILLIHRDGIIVFVNNITSNFFGYSRNELIGSDLFLYLRQDDWEIVRENISRMVRGELVSDYEVQVIDRFNKSHNVIVKTTLTQYQQEQAILTILTDVTHIREAESSLIDKNLIEYEELSKTFDKLSKVFNTTSILMAISTVDEGRFVDVNNAFLTILGYSREEVIGHTSSDLHIFDDPRLRMEKKDEALQRDGVRDLEVKVRAKNGEIYTGICSCHPITIQDKTYFLSVMNDITERIKIDNALHITNQKLNLLNSITLHDINNQIVILSGFASILEESEISLRVKEYAKKILLASEKIISMIQFSREYHKIGISSPEWLNVKELVNQAFSEVSPGSVTLENNIRHNAEIFSDPLISKVFFNIIENSVRHGGSINKITCSSFETEKGITFTIEDDGTGIPGDMKEKIFEREYGKNTGLGLFITREILGITGITIYETGQSGLGARFELHVPKQSYRILAF